MAVVSQNHPNQNLNWCDVAAFADSSCQRRCNLKMSSKDQVADCLACCSVRLFFEAVVFALNHAIDLVQETYCLDSSDYVSIVVALFHHSHDYSSGVDAHY